MPRGEPRRPRQTRRHVGATQPYAENPARWPGIPTSVGSEQPIGVEAELGLRFQPSLEHPSCGRAESVEFEHSPRSVVVVAVDVRNAAGLSDADRAGSFDKLQGVARGYLSFGQDSSEVADEAGCCTKDR